MTHKKIFYIGVVGTNGAGKTTICHYLEKQYGFAAFSLSDIVREEAKRLHLPLDRDHLVEVGTKLKEEFGETVLAQKVISKAKEQHLHKVVFDSIRHIKEVRYLKEHGAEIFAVDASVETRYARIKKRGKQTDNVDFATFCKHDIREREGHRSGQHINEALKEADFLFDNEGRLEDLYAQIEAGLKQFYA